MRKLFYPKLAAENIKKNSKTYIPYILTCTGIIAMFYIMASLSENKGIAAMKGAESVRSMLSVGTWVITIFSVIFMFYTNSFLIKRRKKEFGLYNILGMEKRHISKIILFETLYCTLICIITGILSGMLLSKLMHLLLLKLLRYEVQMGFEISLFAIKAAVTLFCVIFLLTFLYTLLQIRQAKPIELLKGGETGEKEPKTKLVMTIAGAVCLGIAYYISLTVTSPLDAIYLFLLAVILVIIGTYFLFIAGSIALLKLLRKNKKYYYKSNNFTAISGMIYRMKQNAAGLASICILSTAVLVMISTTVSLYIGMEDVLRTRYPRNIEIAAKFVSGEEADEIDRIISDISKTENVDINNSIRYMSKSVFVLQSGNKFVAGGENNGGFTAFVFFPLDEYNRLMNDASVLSDDEVMIYTSKGNINEDSILFGEKEYKIKSRLQKFIDDGQMSAMMINVYYVVMPDTKAIQTACGGLDPDEGDSDKLDYYCGFDINADDDIQIQFSKTLSEVISGSSIDVTIGSAAANRDSFFMVYGGLFFLGIFLGALFIMATVLIIYYKQISEGYDDKVRFDIMQKVGMSKSEIKSTIKSQVLAVFFLPLIAACIHIAFAFKVITLLLALFNLTNIMLFAFCVVGTILVFTVFYAIVYSLTAKTYYKIIK